MQAVREGECRCVSGLGDVVCEVNQGWWDGTWTEGFCFTLLGGVYGVREGSVQSHRVSRNMSSLFRSLLIAYVDLSFSGGCSVRDGKHVSVRGVCDRN